MIFVDLHVIFQLLFIRWYSSFAVPKSSLKSYCVWPYVNFSAKTCSFCFNICMESSKSPNLSGRAFLTVFKLFLYVDTRLQSWNDNFIFLNNRKASAYFAHIFQVLPYSTASSCAICDVLSRVQVIPQTDVLFYICGVADG